MTTSKWIGDGPFGAVFSPCRKYRYSLWRRWDCRRTLFDITSTGDDLCGFIGVNPSTADEIENDRTVSRCITFARDWGFTGMVMLNCFGYRNTDPEIMFAEDEPVGPENNDALEYFVNRLPRIVAAWGNAGLHRGRSTEVRQILRGRDNVFHLGMTEAGEPKHPLYLLRTTEPELWLIS